VQLVISKSPSVPAWGHYAFISPTYKFALLALAGQRVRVETDYLFVDQFNAAPLSKRRARRLVRRAVAEHPYWACYADKAVHMLSGHGLRINHEHVSRVLADARDGRRRCNWCGNHSEADGGRFCPHCGHEDGFERLDRVKRSQLARRTALRVHPGGRIAAVH
jgi:hypothetical protein